MKKKTAKRSVARRSSPARVVTHRANPKHLGQMEMLLLVVMVIFLIGIVGYLLGVLPGFTGYPKVLSAMVGR